MAEPASAITNNLSFPGQYWDAEAALNYNWHRHYDPGLGRYVETDPLGMGSGDRNTYVYAWDKPLRASDPWGLWGEDVHSGINNSSYGTYTWARQIGFTEAASKRIALANDATDGGFASWMPMIGLQSRHFNQFSYGEYQDSRAYWADLEFRRAIEYYKKGECQLALARERDCIVCKTSLGIVIGIQVLWDATRIRNGTMSGVILETELRVYRLKRRLGISLTSL